jgi:hypothetical protein
MYDKQGSVLRVEAVTNDPRDLRAPKKMGNVVRTTCI